MHDKSRIMKEAWALAKGVAFGTVRPCLNRAALWARDGAAERRRMFRFFLRQAWSKAKARTAEIARRAAEAAAWAAAPVVAAPRRPMVDAQVELLSLECKDRWTPADFRRAQELRLAA